MTNKLNPGKRTEAAIRNWLALLKEKRTILTDSGKGLICLNGRGDSGSNYEIGRFTLASLIRKRYPRRKKKK